MQGDVHHLVQAARHQLLVCHVVHQPQQLGHRSAHPHYLLQELLADQPPPLLAALLRVVLDEAVGHIVMAAVDEPHHEMARHPAKLLGLGVGEGQQPAHLLLLAGLAEDEDELQVVAVTELRPGGLALRHHALHTRHVAVLGVGAGQREESLLGGSQAGLFHQPQHPVRPGQLPGLAVPQDQGVEDVLVDCDALGLHHHQHLVRPLDVSVLAVSGDEALVGLLVGPGPLLPHVGQHLLR